jgi:RNA polymerase-binding transcription factor DksA
MDKKRLDYYKKKLATRREELVRAITRTEQEGREADEDTTVDMADKAANSYTKEFLPRGIAAKAPRGRALDALLHYLPGKNRTRAAVNR